MPYTAKNISSFGTFQFEEHVEYDQDDLSGGLGLQKVPGTPPQMAVGTAVPATGNYRLSCARKLCLGRSLAFDDACSSRMSTVGDMPSAPGGRADVQLRSVMEVRIL